VPPEAEDGVLHAEDVSELDLEGSELVVLSACDTARGEVQSGEGVFGLRRAFVLAGARTVVMSLWKVDDSRTKDLMEKFYERIPRVGGHAEALRCAQLWLKKAHPSPTLWGAFICQSDVGSGATGDRLACPDD
jgi:CHAT domain-containing protein